MILQALSQSAGAQLEQADAAEQREAQLASVSACIDLHAKHRTAQQGALLLLRWRVSATRQVRTRACGHGEGGPGGVQASRGCLALAQLHRQFAVCCT